MKRDFLTQLTGIDGKPLQKPKAIPLAEWVEEMKDAVATLDMEGMHQLLAKMETLKETPVLTARDVCITALTEMSQDDRGMRGEDKLALDELARRIYNGAGEVEVVAKEIALILDRVNKSIYGTIIVYGQMNRLLNEDKIDKDDVEK